MKCLAVCQTAIVARNLHQALASSLQLQFLVKDRSIARGLTALGISVRTDDPQKAASYRRFGIDTDACVIVEDDGRRTLRSTLRAICDAGATLIYVLSVGRSRSAQAADASREFSNVSTIELSSLLKGSLLYELWRSLTRARVQKYQRHFADADRVLILLHNEPDPDAMASGLALRSLLHRTKTTAIIGAFQGMTRPENVRMANLLDIEVEPVTAESLQQFDRIATVDVQPHYFGGLLKRVDLVVDHHPQRSSYAALFKDIRPTYGSTSTILTEHLRAVDANISERTATAMLYAIKSDTLFFSRQTNRSDLEAFTFLYPLADATLVRKMEGFGVTLERLDFVTRAATHGELRDQIYTTHLGDTPREDLVPYVADFLLQLEDVKWTVVSGTVGPDVIVSVRNLGYVGNAGDFVRSCFSDVGNAGGHRAMAKAVVPVGQFRKKFGSLDDQKVTRLLGALAVEFLARTRRGKRRDDQAATERRPRTTAAHPQRSVGKVGTGSRIHSPLAPTTGSTNCRNPSSRPSCKSS